MRYAVLNGILHEVTKDIQTALTADENILTVWNNLTPVQRNEWICWVITVKKNQTRAKHIERMIEELKEGRRQPCCWPGCPHRRPDAKKRFNNPVT